MSRITIFWFGQVDDSPLVKRRSMSSSSAGYIEPAPGPFEPGRSGDMTLNGICWLTAGLSGEREEQGKTPVG